MKFPSPKGSCSSPLFLLRHTHVGIPGLETERHRHSTGSKDSSILRRRNLGHAYHKLISRTPFHSPCPPCQSPTRRKWFLSACRLFREPSLVGPIVRLTPWHHYRVVGRRFEQANARGSHSSSGLGKCGCARPDRH
jgi:hypothetical protein